MSFMAFQDHDDNELIASRKTSTKINYIWIFIASTVYFISGLFFTERDLFSTMHWWDSLNIQPAGMSSNYLFTLTVHAAQGEQLVGVTTIAVAASLGIWAMQVVVGFALAQRGQWSVKSARFMDFVKSIQRGNESFADISQEKLILFFALVSAMIIDTSTDIAWLGSGSADLGQAIFTSLFFHNFVSELAVFFGGKMMVESFLGLVRRYQGRDVPRKQQQKKGNNDRRNLQQRGRNNNQRNQNNRQRPQDAMRQARPRPHRPQMPISADFEEIDFE